MVLQKAEWISVKMQELQCRGVPRLQSESQAKNERKAQLGGDAMSECRTYWYDDDTRIDVTFEIEKDECSTPRGVEHLEMLRIKEFTVTSFHYDMDVDITEALKKARMLRYFRVWAEEKFQREGEAA